MCSSNKSKSVCRWVIISIGIILICLGIFLAVFAWLSLGGKLEMLPQSSYYHRVDSSSFYKQTEDDSKRRLLEIFKRFEHGEPCREEFLAGLRSGRL